MGEKMHGKNKLFNIFFNSGVVIHNITQIKGCWALVLAKMGTKSKVKMKIDRVKSSITKHLWLNETSRLG
jgi:hypothetical protein